MALEEVALVRATDRPIFTALFRQRRRSCVQKYKNIDTAGLIIYLELMRHGSHGKHGTGSRYRG